MFKKIGKIKNSIKIFFGKLFSESTSVKVIALLLTLILWGTVVGGREIRISRDYKINFILPENVVINNDRIPNVVNVQLQGAKAFLQGVQKQKNNLSFNLSKYELGKINLKINQNLFDLPIGVKIVKITPNNFELNLEKAFTKQISVKLNVAGKPPFGYKIDKIEYSPKIIEIVGPKEILNKSNSIETENIDVSKFFKSSTLQTELKGMEQYKFYTNPTKKITVDINLSEFTRNYWFKNIKIQPKINCDNVKEIKPNKISVLVKVPYSYFELLKDEIQNNKNLIKAYLISYNLNCEKKNHKIDVKMEIDENFKILKVSNKVADIILN